MMIKLPEFPSVRKELLTEAIDGEMVIVHRELANVHQLNPTAAWIWRKLDGTNYLDTITDDFCQVFEVEVDVAHRDIRAFLTKLNQLDLLEE